MDPLTLAGRHILMYHASELTADQRESWAIDVWADAAYDIVQPHDALRPAIDAALIVFDDGSCLHYRSDTPPRETTLSDGLRAMGRLDRNTIATLLDNGSYLVREAALGSVADLE